MSEPRPGSSEAVARDCKCPVIDNHHGLGYGGDGARFGWYVSESCPVHAQRGCLLRASLDALDKTDKTEGRTCRTSKQ